MRRKRNVVLPAPGDAFAIPLADDRFGACRVLRGSNPEELARQGAPYVLAAAANWIGDALPDVNDPRLREILRLTHHAHKGSLEMIWISDAVPASFIPLGRIEPSAADLDMECLAFSSWGSFGLQVLMQWQWDHERGAVEAVDRFKAAETEALRAQAPANYARHLAGLTLDGLLRKRRFTGWRGFVKPGLIAVCRNLFRDTIQSLIDLGDNPPKRDVVRQLRQCILRLNDLDSENGHFIETTLREELSEEFEEIAHAAGVRGYEDLAGRWRDW